MNERGSELADLRARDSVSAQHTNGVTKVQGKLTGEERLHVEGCYSVSTDSAEWEFTLIYRPSLPDQAGAVVWLDGEPLVKSNDGSWGNADVAFTEQ